MKHTTSYYQTAERWVKNAAQTARKHMTYNNAMRALMVASLLPLVSSAAGAVRAGLAAGSTAQVAGGVATGLTAVGSAIPSLAPATQTARTISGLASAVQGSKAAKQIVRRAQEPMTAQAYLNRSNISRARPEYGTAAQYQTAMARMNK